MNTVDGQPDPMGRHQAASLVDRMQAIWPSPAWAPETCAEYVTQLESVPRHIGRVAVDALRLSAKRRPAIAELHEACRTAWQQTYAGTPAALPDLEVLRPPPEVVETGKEAIARIRRVNADTFEQGAGPKRRARDDDPPTPVGHAIGGVLDDVEQALQHTTKGDK